MSELKHGQLNPMMPMEEGRVFTGAGKYKTVRENTKAGPHVVYTQGEDLFVSPDVADVLEVFEKRRIRTDFDRSMEWR